MKAMRSCRRCPSGSPTPTPKRVRLRIGGDPLLGRDLPAIDCVFVGGAKLRAARRCGCVRPGRADIWDSLVTGKLATVRAIHQDLEDRTYVAVTVDDDPASDLHDWYGRSFFFSPDEVEPVTAESAG